jgi:hypothetical protein
MSRQWAKAQTDLFEDPLPETVTTMSPIQRAKVLEQLQSLLTEAMADPESAVETSHDED